MSNKAIMALSALAFVILCAWCLTRNHSMAGAATVAPAVATATLAAPSFNASISGGKVTLDGTLPDEATKAGIITRTKELYGEGNYIDHLKVGSVARPGWLGSLAGLLPALRLKDHPNGGIDVDGNGVVNLTGQVASQEVRTGIVNDVTKTVPANWRINDLMVVSTGPALSDKALEAQTVVNKELVGKIIEFDTGKATIRQGANGTLVLDQVATILGKYDFPFEVSGHTDNRGNPAGNQKLSQARADAVKAYLATKGIAAGRMSAAGYGDKKPLADNNTPEGLQRNRRIEFGIREIKATTTQPKK